MMNEYRVGQRVCKKTPRFLPGHGPFGTVQSKAGPAAAGYPHLYVVKWDGRATPEYISAWWLDRAAAESAREAKSNG